ncbi:hypothetical protein ACHAPY_011552 [Fusarium culmorum]
MSSITFRESLSDENAANHAPLRSIRPFSIIPFPRDRKFVERTDILLWLRDQTAQSGSRAALVGLGGIGKSQVAIHYLYEVREASPDTWVFWVDASSRARFEEAYRNIADKLQLPGRDDPKRNVLQLVHAWLCDGENGPWMMVLDNADSVEVLFDAHDSRDQPLASFLPNTGRGSIVITSRNTGAAARLASRAIYKMPMMEKSQALQLLRNRLGDEGAEDNAAMSDLIDDLNYMPLAITQAAAYIKRREPRMSVSAYLYEFRRSDKNRASLLNADAESASNSIVATWQITFGQIRSERPSAADLLSFISFFRPQGIPKSALQAYVRYHREDADKGLDEDLEVLREYSLVAATADKETFEMHALVQFCTREWLSAFGDRHQWMRKFLWVMSEQYPLGKYENWVECQRLDPHIEFLTKEEPVDMEDTRCWARLLSNAGCFRMLRGRYSEAAQMFRQALLGYEKVLGSEHPDTLMSINNLGSVLQYQGKYEEAEAMDRQALLGYEKVLGSEHPDTLMSINNLGSVLRDQGKYKEAEAMDRQALLGYEKVLGSEHPHTLMSINNLGSVLRDQGKYKEAEAINRRALEGYERILGPEHPDTLISINNLGLVLQHQGKYEEAEKISRRALETREKVLGREHPNTLRSVNNLGSILSSQGKYDEAETMYRQALLGYEKILGREHPDTLTSVNHLGLVLQHQGKHEEAETMYRRALLGYEKVLGPEHPDTLISINNLGLVLQHQGKYEEAETMHWQALVLQTKVLDKKHPAILASINNLALGIHNQRKYKEAEAVMTLLLHKTAGMESKDSYLQIARSWAAEKGFEDVMELLLDGVAGIRMKDREGSRRSLDSDESDSSIDNGSVFSVPVSLPSTVTLGSGTDGINTLLIQELTALFYQDEALMSLISAAVSEETIGFERMRNNFRKLLKHYARNLKAEMLNDRHRNFVGFVSSYSTHIAQELFLTPSIRDQKAELQILDIKRNRHSVGERRKIVEEYLNELNDPNKRNTPDKDKEPESVADPDEDSDQDSVDEEVDEEELLSVADSTNSSTRHCDPDSEI